MREKKYLSMLILTFLTSLAIVSVPPAQSSPSPVTFYIDRNPPLGHIPGVPVNQKVSFDVYVDASELTSGTAEGMVAWGMDIQVDPSVLAPHMAIGGSSGYFLYDYIPSVFLAQGTINTVTGEWKGLSETYMPTPAAGVGGTGLLVTLNFTSKSETGYSWVDITKAEYKDANGVIHTVQVVYGHYNPPTHLHSQSSLIDLESPEGTQWHEIYPTFCANYTLDLWEDNDDGNLSRCDQIGMIDKDTEDMVWFHVDGVTVTIFVTSTIGGKDYEMYWEFNGTYEAALEGNPTGEQWVEIYRTENGVPQDIYGQSQPVIDFDDNDADGNVTIGDRLKTTCDLSSKWYTVQEIATDIIVAYKYPQPPLWPEFPVGPAVEIGLIAAIAYIWLRSRRKTKITKTTTRRITTPVNQ